MDVRTQARLHAVQTKGATLVLTTVPTKQSLQLDNPEFRYKMRLHLGLPPVARMPALHCPCNHPNGSYDQDPWHALSCHDELSTSVTDAHDDLKFTVAKWARTVGAKVTVEPRGLAQDRKHPDIKIRIAGRTILVDTTRRHPLAPSHVRAAAREPGVILKQAEVQKHGTYDKMAQDNGADFVAFAVETTGAWGREALKLIKDIIAAGQKMKQVWQPHEHVYGIYRSVAVAIARGNASIIKSNLARFNARAS